MSALGDPILRDEAPDDHAVIHRVNEAAFGRPDEADLVDSLRREGVALLSSVAELEQRIVGHILFCRMWIDTSDDVIEAVALAPLAVLPRYQRRGIGGRLIRHGLERLRMARERIVIVLGHPDYYPRFGFSTERAGHLVSPFSPEAFMAIELVSGALDGVRGRVRYPAAFGV